MTTAPAHRAWYLLRTRVRQERTALANLVRQHYECWLPLLRAQRRVGGRKVTRVEPLFPSYLFVRLAEGVDNWSPIRSTLGVSKLVRFGDAYARVPDALIAGLRARAGEDGICEEAPPPLVPGQRVLMLDGALAGYEAIFEARTGKARVALLLDLAGRQVRVEADVDSVRPAG